jgi:hypothetical protein
MFEPANQLERLIQSDDGKLLMCGKLIMKLNETHDDLDQIGCIMMTPGEAQDRNYRFLSLLADKDQIVINETLKKNPEKCVSFSFDVKPLYQENRSDIMYFHYIVDMMTGETSIIKLFTDTFICHEIY